MPLLISLPTKKVTSEECRSNTESLKKNDTVEITFRSSYAYSGGLVNKAIDKNEIDIYAIYCPETDQCYYIDPSHFSQSVSLRVGIPRNNQSNGVHWAENFRKVP